MIDRLAARCLLALLSGLMLAGAPAYPALAEGYVDGKPATPEFFRAAQLVNEGLGLIRANRNQDAAVKLEESVRLAPDLGAARLNLGLAYAKLGRYQEAVDQMKKALEINPDTPAALLTLGGVYQSSGHLDLAVQSYKEFLGRYPTHAEAPKVSTLVRGLDGELKKMSGGGKAPEAALLADDYYAEMTAEGRWRWPDKRMPIKVCIKSGGGVANFRPQFTELLKRAFQDWSEVSAGRVTFQFVGESDRPDIVCTWLADARQLSNAAEAGEAKFNLDREGIDNGTIKLLTVPLTPEVPLTDNRMHLNCLHEVGHVLGLYGHTMNPADVMFYSGSLSDEYRHLTARDRNTIIKLYSAP